MSAQPYTAAEIEERAAFVAGLLGPLRLDGHDPSRYPGLDTLTEQERWLATVSALQSRLALADAAVATRDARIAQLEGRLDAAEALLGDARKCAVTINVNGYYDGYIARIDAHLTPAPPKPEGGEVARA